MLLRQAVLRKILYCLLTPIGNTYRIRKRVLNRALRDDFSLYSSGFKSWSMRLKPVFCLHALLRVSSYFKKLHNMHICLSFVADNYVHTFFHKFHFCNLPCRITVLNAKTFKKKLFVQDLFNFELRQNMYYILTNHINKSYIQGILVILKRKYITALPLLCSIICFMFFFCILTGLSPGPCRV